MDSFTLNGRLFVRGRGAVIDTLFRPGGTASGYFDLNGREVRIFKPNGEIDGVITAIGVLGKATRLADGRIWYSYGNLDTVGRWESWSQRCEEIAAAHRAALSPPARIIEHA